MEKVLFTVPEVSARWGCSAAAIRAWIASGKLAKADVPGVMISLEEVRAHEVIMSYGKTPDERELIARLAMLTSENDRLKRENATLTKWKENVIDVLKGE